VNSRRQRTPMPEQRTATDPPRATNKHRPKRVNKPNMTEPTPAAPWQGWKPQCPEHDIRKLLPEFETVKRARREQRRRYRRLQRGNSEEQQLASKLKGCCKKQRCQSAACSICMRRFRLWLSGEMLRLFGNTTGLLFVTLVPPTTVCPADELDTLSPRRMGDMLRQQLIRAGLGHVTAIGGIEVDLNDATQMWEPHFHIIVAGSTPAQFEALREHGYTSDTTIQRPMRTDKVRNPARQFSYCLKSYCTRKVSYQDPRGKQRTRKLRLRNPHHNAALLWLDQQQPTDLVMMRGMRRYGSELRLVGAVSDRKREDPSKGTGEALRRRKDRQDPRMEI
jgi:hypothetical protein